MTWYDFFILNMALIAFFAVYRYVLHKQTHFLLSRIYLLGAVIIAFSLPFLPSRSITTAVFDTSFNLPAFVVNSGEQPALTATGDWLYLATLAYILIGGGILFTTVFRFIDTLKYTRKARPLTGLGQNIFELDQDYSFSFMGKIYLQSNLTIEEQRIILAHEEVHRQQFHMADLFLAELLKAVCWINPVAWWYKRQFMELHEYTADALVTTERDKQAYSALLIAKAIGVKTNELIHPFINSSMLKNRIMMLNKKNSPSRTKLYYTLLIPVFGAMLILASCAKESNETQQKIVRVKHETSDEPMMSVDKEEITTPAQFTGGQEKLIDYLSSNINYPKEAKKDSLDGTVYISFIIDENGAVTDAKVDKGVSPELDEEALSAIKSMPDWSPALAGDKPVKFKMTLPVRFKVM